MPDILDQIAQQQTADENAGIAQARANNTWAQTFSSIPPVEKLRASRNLTDQIATAMERRQALAAQTDANAQHIYFNAQRQKQWQADEPKRMELLQSQIDHQNAAADAAGAHTKFQTDNEAANLKDMAGFMSDMGQMATSPGEDGYAEELGGVLSNYPRVVNTPMGRDVIKQLHQQHRDVSAITPPDGMTIAGLTYDENGNAHASFKPIPPKSKLFASPKEAMEATDENGEPLFPDAQVTDFHQRSNGGFAYVGKPRRIEKTPEGMISAYATLQSQIESVDTTDPDRAAKELKPLLTQKRILLQHYPGLAKGATPATQSVPSATPAVAETAKPATDTVEMGGHHYEVDHAAKKVLRQID